MCQCEWSGRADIYQPCEHEWLCMYSELPSSTDHYCRHGYGACHVCCRHVPLR
jgi:hypothetical protein